jgi:GNAT superfamily N-acetyltransferase
VHFLHTMPHTPSVHEASSLLPTIPPLVVANRNTVAAINRDIIVGRMSLQLTVLREFAAVQAISQQWDALVAATADIGVRAGGLFRGPGWLVPWWHAYHETLRAEPYVWVARADGQLVGMLPLYRRTAKFGLVDITEVRMMGDAGPRPPALDIIAAAGWEQQVGAAFARALIDDGANWDLLQLEPLAEPSNARANLVSRLASAGYSVESSESAGGAHRIALALAPSDSTDGSGVVTTFGEDLDKLRKGMSSLRRLSRLEWAERDEHSPLADAEAAALLEEVTLGWGREGRVRLARLDDASGEAVAAALVVDDVDRAVVLAMAVDPQVSSRGAAPRLLHAEAMAARARGMTALEVVGGLGDYALPMLPTSKHPAIALKVWSQTKSASVGRTFASVAQKARRARETPMVAAAQARAAWTKIRTTASSMAQYERYSLYRGQLWTRDIAAPADLTIARFSEQDYDALDDSGRADLAEQLALDEVAARKLWRRGDWAMIAHLGSRPAGLVWSARGPVEAPELGRTLRLAKYDVYIHSVYVSPAARGRAVAPAMLEALTKELRATDAYRSWALIAADNQASLRAFQKASFTPVCDVIYAKMAAVDKVIVRPPDPEARELLGL